MCKSFLEQNQNGMAQKVSKKEVSINERQGVVIPVLGVPFLAAALPTTAAAAIGIYATYGDEIASLFNSIFSKHQNFG